MKITNNFGQTLNYFVYSSGSPSFTKKGTISDDTSLEIDVPGEYCYGAFFSNEGFEPQNGTALGTNNNLQPDATITLSLTGNNCTPR